MIFGRIYLIIHIDNRPQFLVWRERIFPRRYQLTTAQGTKILEWLDAMVETGALISIPGKGKDIVYERNIAGTEAD